MHRLFLIAVLLYLAAAWTAQAEPAAPDSLDRPGYLVLTAAQDPDAGYAQRAGPGPGQVSWYWDGGQLVLPDTLSLETFGSSDMGVGTLTGLRGSGADGVLRFRDGAFTIDQPLLLTDGRISLYIAEGTLEIRGAQVRYLPPVEADPQRKPADPRAGFLFLGGMVILTLVMLRLARRRLGRRPS